MEMCWYRSEDTGPADRAGAGDKTGAGGLQAGFEQEERSAKRRCTQHNASD